jgi:uncharacterized tellurite resistance protein B-like protein
MIQPAGESRPLPATAPDAYSPTMTTHWIERLSSVFHGHARADLDQRQREALIDLLVWIMFVDRHIAALEQESVEEAAAGLPWDSPQPVEVFLDGSVRRIREVLGDSEAEAQHLAELASRLIEPAARERAYAACERLARIDGQLSQRELELLERIRAALGLG